MTGKAKIAEGSLWTEADQLREYEALKGAEAAQRQIRAARLARGLCVCTPQRVKGRWEGSDTKTVRTIHDQSCPRFKAWMGQEQ